MTIPTAAYFLQLVCAVICSLLLKYNKTDSMSSEHTKHKKKAVHMFVYDFSLRFCYVRIGGDTWNLYGFTYSIHPIQ